MTRMRSLKTDNNDWSKLRHGRERHIGTSIAMEYFQHCPFFFTREGANVDIVGQYRGAAGFLIASGPSFNQLNKELLRTPGVWAMTLNNAVASWRGQAACIVDDPCRFTMSLWLDPSIQKFVPMSAFEKPLWDNRMLVDQAGNKEQQWAPANIKVGDCPNVIGYRRNEKFVAGRYLYEDTINWGCHKDFGGGRSVMLAAMRIMFLLGFRRVYLVGVDFNMTPELRYSFQEGRTNSAINGNMSTYEKLKKWFAELQPYFLQEGFIVQNVNPNSALTAFPFIKFEDAIREATGHIGDPKSERTEGMYVTYENKIADYERARGLGQPTLPPPAPSAPIHTAVPQMIDMQPQKPPAPIVVSAPPQPRPPPPAPRVEPQSLKIIPPSPKQVTSFRPGPPIHHVQPSQPAQHWQAVSPVQVVYQSPTTKDVEPPPSAGAADED